MLITLTPSYDLCGKAAIALASDLSVIPKGERVQLTLSLRHVRQLDATGLAMLVRAHAAVSRHGGHISLVDVGPNVATTLRSVGLHRLWTLRVDAFAAMPALAA